MARCEIQRKFISIEEAWDVSTASFSIYLNRVMPASCVEMYGASTVIARRCVFLTEIISFLKWLRVLESTPKD